MRGKPVRTANRRTRKVPWTRRLAQWVPLLAVTGLLVAVPFAAKAAYMHAGRTALLPVTDVRVTGLRHVRQADFLKYMGDPEGGSLLGLDLSGMVARVSAHPWIKDVSVRRELPGSVRVDVTERTPAAVAETGAGRYLIDGEGLALARVETPDWDFLPVIEYPQAKSLKILDTASAAELKHALELMGSMKDDPSERLTGARVCMDNDGSPCMVVEGTMVKLGLGGYGDKLRRLAEVSKDIQKRGVNPVLIDLRFPGKVVVKGAGAQGPQATPSPEVDD